MLATQPPRAQPAARIPKGKRAVKNKANHIGATARPCSCPPSEGGPRRHWPVGCDPRLRRPQHWSVKPYVRACLDHVTRIAIERWKHITLERQRSKNDETWSEEGKPKSQSYVCFLLIISGRQVLAPITADTSYADLYKLGREILGLNEHPSKSLRLCYHVPWVTFPGDENDAICSRSDIKVIASGDRRRTIRAFPVHA